ncbi:hypothetical protein BK147_20090 [Paenibacillus sp. FSL R7-0337]|nr:hypothetical protein C162_07284 [Paenibacillus sp. FSL R7-269]OMF92599.1 hypothetical protein BK147_20090 [Paenibacillus sp. FSL R7-0337]
MQVVMKNVKILLFFFGFAAVMVLLFGWGLPVVFQLFLHNDYMRSLTLLVVFSIIVLVKRLSWSTYLVFAVAVFSFLGMMIDTAGNPVYNKPLQWIVSSIGQLQLDQDVNNYAPGQYVISDNLAILKPGGEMVTLSTVWLYLYRLAQYMVLYSIVGTVLAAVRGSRPERWPVPAASVDETLTPDMEQRVAAELKRREAASTTLRVVPEEVQEHVRQLKKDGKLILAIKLVRQHTDMPLGEAKRYVEEM